MAKKWTHRELCDLAVKWLKRPSSRKGPGCHIAVSETQSGWDGEVPDAIGFRAAGYLDGSVLVEVKVSRSDFLADARKPHRCGEVPGMGDWRYYLSPVGLIQVEELPERWGLLWVTDRGHIKPQAGPVMEARYTEQQGAWEAHRFDADRDREQWMLVKLLARYGDVEETKRKVRNAYRARDEMAREVDRAKQQNREMRRDLYRTKRLLEAAERMVPGRSVEEPRAKPRERVTEKGES